MEAIGHRWEDRQKTMLRQRYQRSQTTNKTTREQSGKSNEDRREKGHSLNGHNGRKVREEMQVENDIALKQK